VIFIVVFMPLYYLFCGWVANLGLLIYITLVVGGMAAMGSTLTLPGIAGFILSVGMAVDANVLIFERMREEMATGKGARAVVSAGYHRAFSAILDSNVTTLITSVLLFIFGTGPIQGFAVTLSIGIVASMFSSIFVTRVILDAVVKRIRESSKCSTFQEPGYRVFKGRFWAYGFSAICLAFGIFVFTMRGPELWRGVHGGHLCPGGFQAGRGPGEIQGTARKTRAQVHHAAALWGSEQPSISGQDGGRESFQGERGRGDGRGERGF
jgi:SecD/SecF fusion protein